MRRRHREELRKAGLLPAQMESDFYRLKFKREAKMKATPPNSATNTPHSSPPRKTTTGTAPPRTAVDGAGGSFARAAGGESTAAGPGVGYEEEVSWSVRTRASEPSGPTYTGALGMPREEDAVEHPGPELDPSAAAAQAIAEADGDAEVLQAAIAAQAQARAKAKGMSSGYAAMSNSLLRKALKG